MPVSFPKGDPRLNLAALERALREGCNDACIAASNAVAAAAKRNVTDVGAIDRGILRSSIGVDSSRTAGGATATVYVGAAHGRWVEFGRAGIKKDPRKDKTLGATAAWPPVLVIAEWVRRHVRSLAPGGRTKTGRARRANQKDIDRMTFLVGRKIYLYGIKPRPFLGPAFRIVARSFRNMVYEAARARLAAVLGRKNP